MSRCAQRDAVVDKALDELRGGDRTALARADILHVGDRRIDQPVERLGQRHGATACRRVASPAASSCAASSSSLARRGRPYSWPRVITIAPVRVARSMIAFGLYVALRLGDRVAQHQAAFGVGVDDLDRLARHGGDDVARALGIAVRHVLDQAADADDIGLGLAQRRAPSSRPTTAPAPPMSHFIASMLCGRLDRDAAGVEGHALADEGDRRVALACRRSSSGPAAAARAPNPGRRRAARPCRASPSPRRRAPRSRGRGPSTTARTRSTKLSG